MEQLAFYCKKGCKTCQKAASWLREKGVPFEFIDYTKRLPPEDVVRRIFEEYGANALRRRHPRFKELKSASMEAWLEAVREDAGVLIRPIVLLDAGHYLAGFDPEFWQAALTQHGFIPRQEG